VHCEERERLEKLYLAAVAENSKTGLTIPDMRSEAWRKATKQTREACETALANLNAHRKEHGC
jgi:hypothetical protein